MIIVKTNQHNHLNMIIIIICMQTCILSLDTVKAAAPSITSLSITCLVFIAVDYLVFYYICLFV